ncbi:MAG TPA: hypothetical protein VMU51_34270 [Mycobacteriales bacterium]|nr:hypothetical protein [Mycobacteriales bacterium]
MAGTIKIAILANGAQAGRELAGVDKRVRATMDRFRTLGDNIKTALKVGAAVGAVGVVTGLLGAFNAASDLNETISKSGQVFGAQAAQVEAFAASADKSMGVSKQAALDAASAQGAYFKQIGLTSEQTKRFALENVKLASDLASFNNVNPTDALEAMQAALVGEYDPIQKLIPGITAATVQTEALRLSHKKSATALTEVDKQMALHSLFLKGSTQAQGDFARTSGGAANQARILKAEFQNIVATVGQKLLPIGTRLVGFAARTLPGAFKSLGNAASVLFKGDFKGGIFGQLEDSKLVDVLFRIRAAAIAAFGYFKTEVLPRLKDFGSFLLGTVVPAVTGFVQWMIRSKDVLIPLAVGVGAMVAAFKVWRAITLGMALAQTVLNVVLAANPIGLVVLAVVGLVAGLVVLYKRSEAFRSIVQAIWGWLKANWPLLLGILIGPVGVAIAWIVTHWDQTVSFFKGLPGKIGRAVAGLFKGPTDQAAGAITWLRQKWDGFVGWVKALPGKITKAALGMFKGITDQAAAAAAKVTSLFNTAIDKILGREGTFTKTGAVPHHAGGTGSAPAGWAWVGERGPELVRFGGGEQVVNARDSAAAAAGGTVTVELVSTDPLLASLLALVDARVTQANRATTAAARAGTGRARVR